MTSIPVVRLNDVKRLIQNHLLKTPAVTELCDDRVYMARSQVYNQNGDPGTPCVALDQAQGRVRQFGGVQRPIFNIICCSRRSPDEAQQLYDEVFLALHAQQLYDPSGQLKAVAACYEQRRPYDGSDEQTKDYTVTGQWRVHAAKGPGST